MFDMKRAIEKAAPPDGTYACVISYRMEGETKTVFFGAFSAHDLVQVGGSVAAGVVRNIDNHYRRPGMPPLTDDDDKALLNQIVQRARELRHEPPDIEEVDDWERS